MNMFYENTGSNSFLCYKLDAGEKLDPSFYGVLSNNKIDNVLSPIYSVEDASEFLRYNITGKIPLDEYFTGIVRRKRVLKAFYSIVNGFLAADDYIIDNSIFNLDIDSIFVDVNTYDAYLVAIPVTGFKCETNIFDFFKSIMVNLNYDKDEDNSYFTELLNFFNSGKNHSLSDLKTMLFDMMSQTESARFREPKTEEKKVVINKDQRSVFSKEDREKLSNIVKESKEKISAEKDEISKIIKEEKKEIKKEIVKDIKGEDVSDEPVEKMSFIKLMSNFSKENLELYKAQKNSGASQPATKASKPAKKEKTAAKKSAPSGLGFAVPGGSDDSNILVSVKEEKKEVVKQTIVQPEKKETAQKKESIFSKKTEQKVAMDSKKVDFGATMYFDDKTLNSTVMLDQNIISGINGENKIEAMPRIIRKSTNEAVDIACNPFRIGKNADFVDYCVEGNPAISGSHAFIYCENEQFYIKDTNSSNHVFLNGNMIQNNQLVEINDGDAIRLANEDFEFKLY